MHPNSVQSSICTTKVPNSSIIHLLFIKSTALILFISIDDLAGFADFDHDYLLEMFVLGFLYTYFFSFFPPLLHLSMLIYLCPFLKCWCSLVFHLRLFFLLTLCLLPVLLCHPLNNYLHWRCLPNLGPPRTSLWGPGRYLTVLHWLIVRKGLILTSNSTCYKLNISFLNCVSKFALFLFFLFFLFLVTFVCLVWFSLTPLPPPSSGHHRLPEVLNPFLSCFSGIYFTEFKIQTVIFKNKNLIM